MDSLAFRCWSKCNLICYNLHCPNRNRILVETWFQFVPESSHRLTTSRCVEDPMSCCHAESSATHSSRCRGSGRSTASCSTWRMSDTDSECQMAVYTFDRRMAATSESTSAKSCHSEAMTLPPHDSTLSVCDQIKSNLILLSVQVILLYCSSVLYFILSFLSSCAQENLCIVWLIVPNFTAA